MITYLIRGFLLLAIGIISFVSPKIGITLFIYIFAILLLSIGVMQIVHWIAEKAKGITKPFGVRVVDGLVNFFIGATMIFLTAESKVSSEFQYIFIFRLSIIWFLLWGVFHLLAIFFTDEKEDDNKIMSIIFSALAIIFGIILLFVAKIVIILSIRILGVGSICLGVINITDALSLIIHAYNKKSKNKS